MDFGRFQFINGGLADAPLAEFFAVGPIGAARDPSIPYLALEHVAPVARIDLVSKSQQVNVGTTNTTVTAPAGIVDGHVLIGLCETSSSTAADVPALPAGFTQIGTILATTHGGFETRLIYGWKRAASESGNYTFTHTATDNSVGFIAVYKNCLASGTPVGTAVEGSGTGTTSTGSSVTMAATRSYLIAITQDWQGGSGFSPPGGMTERLDVGGPYYADEYFPSALATGNRSHTNSNTAPDPWVSAMFELKAALLESFTFFAGHDSSAALAQRMRQHEMVGY